jgi:hypothetical protein
MKTLYALRVFARLHRTLLLSEAALVGSQETATAPLPPDMLVVRNYACS